MRKRLAETLGRYLLQQKIASGGMAEVFLAKQSGPDGFERLCVVKRVLAHLADEDEFVKMFLDEARLVAQLSHPNIAQIFDFGSHEGTYFLAMEYVPGVNLRSMMKEHERSNAFVPFAHAARIISLVAQALDAAHNAVAPNGAPLNVIHRDVSPQNVLLSKTGMVKLIDFGIAKADSASIKTRPGFIKGKFSYMSPEQILGQPLDRRSDIFSLGLVLYELLANRTAAPGHNDAQAMQILVHAKIDPVSNHRAGVPQPLNTILDRALQRRREDRYPTAVEMSQALERFITDLGVTLGGDDLARLLSAAQTPTHRVPAMAEPSDSGVEPTLLRGSFSRETAPLGDQPPPPTTQERSASEAQITAPKIAAGHTGRWVAIVGTLVALGVGSWAGSMFWRREPPATPVTAAPPVPVPSPAPTPAPIAQREPDPPAPVAPPKVERARPGHAPKIAAPAAPTAASGTLQASASLAAQVTVDGVARGAVPVRLSLPAGEHRMTFANAPLGLSQARTFRIAAGESHTESWSPAKGEVAFRVSPFGEVFQNGHSLGTTPLKPIELYEGHYSFKVVNPDTKRWVSKEVDVVPGEQTVVKVDLGDEP